MAGRRSGTISSVGVITINGTQVTETFNGLRTRAAQLSRELRNLTPGTEEFVRTSGELRQVQQRFGEIRAEVNQTNETIRESSTEIRNFSDLGSHLADRFATGISGTQLNFQSLGAGIRTFAVQSWAAISSIPLIGWVAAVAAGIGLMVKQVFDFNNDLSDANKLTAAYTKLKGEALDTMTVRTQTLEEVFGFDRKEVLEVAKNLVATYGITYEEAMDKIERGAIKGGSANSEFLESLREYPVFFQKAGFSVEEFINIVNAGFDLGIYQDKLPDAIKEFDLSMREQTKSTRDALVNAFGAPFADDILKRVSQGKTTVKESLIEINKEAEKYNLTQKQQAQLTADIFRGAGEDVGGFAKIMDAVTLSMIQQGGELTEQQQIIADQISNYNELGEAKIDALKSDSILAFKRDAENAWIAIQKGWYNMIAGLRTGHTYVQAAVMTIAQYVAVVQIKVTDLYKGVIRDIGYMAASFKELSAIFKSMAKLDFAGADEAFDRLKIRMKTAFSSTKEAIGNLGKDSGISFSDNFNKILAQDKLKADAQRIIDQRRANADKKGNNFDGSQEADKAGDAARKKALADSKKAASENKKLQEEIKKDLEASVKDYENAEKSKLDIQEKIAAENFKNQAESLQKELAVQENARQEELRKLIEQGDAIQDKIFELEKKKLEAKSPVAKANYDKALKEELDARYQNDLLIEKTEETHGFKLKTIREKWEVKKLEDFIRSEGKLLGEKFHTQEEEIQNITSLEDAKERLRNSTYLKLTDTELSQIDTLEKAKAALREEANRKMLDAQLTSMEEQREMLTNQISQLADGPEKKKLLEDLETLKTKILEVRGAMQAGSESDKGKVTEDTKNKKGKIDILGFSAQDWDETFDNIDTLSEAVKGAAMIFTALGNAANLYSELQRALGARELNNFEKVQNSKKTELDRQLALGLISQEQYKNKTLMMDAELANKQAEIEYKQAKADKISRLFSAAGAVALGIANALSLGLPGIAIAAIVGALGAVQIATIAMQPLPEPPSFAEGGYFEGFTGDSNLPADASGERPVGLAKLHRKEFVVPRWMTEHPRISKRVHELDYIRRTKNIPEYAEGGFVDNTTNGVASNTSNSTDSNSTLVQYMSVMSDVKNLLEALYTEGVHISDNAKNGKKMNQMVKNWQTLENKNKH